MSTNRKQIKLPKPTGYQPRVMNPSLALALAYKALLGQIKK